MVECVELSPRFTGGADVLALTIERVQPHRTRRGWRAFLVFRACPHVLWLNQYDVAHLKAKLGETREMWVGKAVPLVRVRNRNPRTREYVERYQVASPLDWDAVLNEARPTFASD